MHLCVCVCVCVCMCVSDPYGDGGFQGMGQKRMRNRFSRERYSFLWGGVWEGPLTSSTLRLGVGVPSEDWPGTALGRGGSSICDALFCSVAR